LIGLFGLIVAAPEANAVVFARGLMRLRITRPCQRHQPRAPETLTSQYPDQSC
jgi:hypothetical protein